MIRAACSQIQSLPSCTSSDAAEMASMNPISSIVMPSVTIGARTISGTSTSRPRCWESQRRANVRPPPPMTAAMASPTGAEHPVVDRGHRDDVHVRGGDAGRGQRDCTDAPAGAGVEPDRDADQRPGQHGTCADSDFGPQDAGLRGEHQQQHHTDERDCDAGDGEHLADPVRVAWWPEATVAVAASDARAAGRRRAG